MKEKKTAIYISKVFPPYLTLQFQEDTCRTICQMRDLNNIVLIKDVDENRTNLNYLFDHPSEYDHLVVYSLSCLGKTLNNIMDNIEILSNNNIKIISSTDPINLDSSPKNAQDNFILTTIISVILHTNNVWEEITNFRNKN